MTAVAEIDELVQRYWTWLRDKTSLKDLNGWVEITTPYLDRHNDYIQIYAKQEGDELSLSDDGYTINDLYLSGCSIDTDKRKEILNTILNGLGVKKDHNTLIVKALPENFALRKHSLIQAILAVNDMFFMASATVKSLFFEDVEKWLEESGVRFTQHVKFSGRSGFDHHFDFVIPHWQDIPERIVQTVNKPDRNAALNLISAWNDTREARPAKSTAFAILNDQGQRIPVTVQEALNKYEINAVLWSQRDNFRNQLAA